MGPNSHNLMAANIQRMSFPSYPPSICPVFLICFVDLYHIWYDKLSQEDNIVAGRMFPLTVFGSQDTRGSPLRSAGSPLEK